jgi:hypothetical protein
MLGPVVLVGLCGHIIETLYYHLVSYKPWDTIQEFQSTFGQYAHAYTVHITKYTIQSNGQCHYFIKHISLSYTVLLAIRKR